MIAALLRSPWSAWIGLRYLKSKKNSRFLSLITLLSIGGVGVGVTAMIVVLSVMDGFEASLKKQLMSSDLHILISPTEETQGFEGGVVNEEVFVKAGIASAIAADPILRDQIKSISPILSTEAILKIGRKVSGVTLKGVDSAKLDKIKATLTEKAEPQMLSEREGAEMVKLPGVYIGQELAFEIGLIPGDRVNLISPTQMEGPLSSVPRMKRFVVEGIYKSGTPEQELQVVFTEQEFARSFLRRVGSVSQWEITVQDFEKAPELAIELKSVSTGIQNQKLKVQDWIELNSHLFASLRLERFAMSVALAFIIVVASFNIVTTLTLMVLEKRREISILKAMGAKKNEVASIFLAEGLLIGACGIGGGTLLAFLVCMALRRYDFVALPDIFYDRTLPVTFKALYYLGVDFCALVIVLAACIYPSKKAASLDPLEGIRFG